MLLAEKPNAVEHLARACPCRFETFLELGVFQLELFDSLGSQLRSASASVYRFHPGFRLKRPAAEARELFAKVAHEPR
jgi:hypothetical protein